MSDRLLKESDVLKIAFQLPLVVNSAFADAVKALPSADRPQGEWLKFGLGRGTRILFCTNCERRIEVPLSQGDSNYDFCPNCGADMRKGANDETNH